MRTLLTSLIFVFLALPQSHARIFLRSQFSASADYEDMAGNYYRSTIEGVTRISDDFQFCAIDLPDLGINAECRVVFHDNVRNYYGIEFEAATAQKIILLLVEKGNWPKDVITRADQLLKGLKSIRLGEMKINGLGSYWTSSWRSQLHDDKVVDSLHVFYLQGINWKPY